MKYPNLALALLLVSILYTIKITTAQNTPQDFVNAHNIARQSEGVEPVRWSTTLASYAENYANRQTGNCLPLQHSGGPYGENLFWGSGRSYTAEDAVNNWVSEKQFYDYNTNTCATGRQCGHYTQVVWAKSTMIGCARRMCDGGSYYIICEYDPQGNMIGEHPY